jgi:hypothetical protein
MFFSLKCLYNDRAMSGEKNALILNIIDIIFNRRGIVVVICIILVLLKTQNALTHIYHMDGEVSSLFNPSLE